MNGSHVDLSIGRILRHTLAVVLAGGRGTRLRDLTRLRAKPAVPFAGKYRIIDFTLSNCINSGLRRICILTQYRSHALLKHVERGWSMSRPEFDEFIEVLPAQERHAESSWYQGTADAVYQNLDIIRDHEPRYVLVLAGDHVYKMDYGMMVAAHIDHDADVTVGCVQVPLAEASAFGVMQVDADDNIVAFAEKPAAPEPMPGSTTHALGSMGIYLFRADFLFEVLGRDAADGRSRHDFGGDIIPALVGRRRLVACRFDDLAGGGAAYWRDVGTIDAYWRTNLEIAGVTPPLDLYDEDWPIHTAPRELPPAKFVFDDDGRRGIAIDSLVANGCIVSGATVRRSVLSDNVRIEQGSLVEDCVVLPDARIGARCRVRRAVIDSGAHIPDDTEIGYDAAADAERFELSPGGVVLVGPGMLGEPDPVCL
ncbi:MAG: glucose-1-phosphate adenylyltransferase [Gammaproteobacteria bacterium]|nr:glucose-1-phosphate adenylyltransferase [Gammaproteobacteria bacterium]MCP5201483.1 glucose-1-phosphate adenylyltransferase [Gammaproteobacteria bacterium]